MEQGSSSTAFERGEVGPKPPANATPRALAVQKCVVGLGRVGGVRWLLLLLLAAAAAAAAATYSSLYRLRFFF